jgi:hypothetical protein
MSKMHLFPFLKSTYPLTAQFAAQRTPKSRKRMISQAKSNPTRTGYRFRPSSTPISKSSSASTSRLITGPAAPGSSLVSKAACSCTSSSSSSRKRPRPCVTGGGAGAEVEGEAVEELPPLWARERTMSFLQMGQVRRRVVSQGVLSILLISYYRQGMDKTGKRWGETYMQASWNSWPQGRLMTRLMPSSYSSRQTTHSRCFPP